MTKEEKYILAGWAVKHALDSGADQAAIVIYGSKNSEIEVREDKIDVLKESIESSMSIRLYVDNKYSSRSTNRLNKDELARFIEEGIKSTRFLAEDKFRSLPDPGLYFKGEGIELKTVDPEFDSVDPDTKVKLAFNVEKEALGKDDRILSVTASYYDSISETIMVASNGFEGDKENSYFGLNSSVSVDGGEARPLAWWNESAITFDALKKTEIGSKALELAIKRIGQKKIKSGKYPMIVENLIAGNLFYPLVSALYGYNIQQKNSFLIDKLGEKVASSKLTLTDDPFIVGGRGSMLFDSEGLATKKRVVFDNGVLGTYFIDTYYAKKLDMAPSTGNPSNFVFKTGDMSLEELVKSLKKGILVTGFNGGNTNGTTGDFSYGIEGFLIENGELAMPVYEMNITGNMKELWMNLAELGNDPKPNTSWMTPSMLFNGVEFSGL